VKIYLAVLELFFGYRWIKKYFEQVFSGDLNVLEKERITFR
jgi:uncharacterized membrane protein